MHALTFVADFHEKFRKPKFAGANDFTRSCIAMDRERLLKEETGELIDAVHAYSERRSFMNFCHVMKEVTDIVYVALGAAVECGATANQLSRVWRVVHASNMAKEPGPTPTSKAIKPRGWKKPNVAAAIKRDDVAPY